ncbi:MAG: glycosyltransferase [Candidatus Aminicenantaceae bacterium]
MDISIVIPAYNESKKIGIDIKAAAQFIKNNKLDGEIIVVDDGSQDSTAPVARSTPISSSVKLKVLRFEKNLGKGMAVKTGIINSSGDVVLFADSGVCVPFSSSLAIINKINSGEFDIALGSRKLKESKIIRNRSWKRRLLSWLFRTVAILFLGMPRNISDSQCGFKLYKGNTARKLFQKMKTTGYLFELEILLRALKSGYRIKEFPVEWTCDLDTRLHPGREAFSLFREFFKVRKIINKL